MHFGFSGRQSAQATAAIISGSNRIRAGWLASLIECGRVMVRRVVRGEVHSFPDPAFEGAIRWGYTYPHDWIATLQAFIGLLRADYDLSWLAESQGVTVEGVEYMIEQIHEGIGSGNTTRGGYEA